MSIDAGISNTIIAFVDSAFGNSNSNEINRIRIKQPIIRLDRLSHADISKLQTSSVIEKCKNVMEQKSDISTGIMTRSKRKIFDLDSNSNAKKMGPEDDKIKGMT